MSEWKECTIDSIGKIITGKTPRTAIEGNYGGEIPFLTPSDDLSVKHVDNTKRYLTQQGLEEVKNCLIPANSICVSCIGSDLGKVVMTQENTVTNQQINSIIPNKDYDSDFVYYLMILVGEELNSLGKTSTAVPIVNKKTFSEWKISVPTLPTQQRIASILSSLDAKIENNNKINAKLEEIAQNLFKEWFVDFGPFKNGKFVESELGLIPEGWRVGTLGEILDIKYGKDHKKLGNGQIPVYGSGGLMRYANKYLYDQESVLIPRKGTLNNIMYVTEPFWTVDTMFYSEVKIPNSAIFAYQFLSQKDMNQLNSGTSIPSMTTEILNKQKLSISSEKVMQEYNNIVKSLYDQIKHNKLEASKLSTLRDTLLPKLMSGEIEV